MGQTKFNTTAVVTAEKLGQDGKPASNTRTGSILTQDRPAISSCLQMQLQVPQLVQLKVSQLVNGIEYFVSATEVTLQNYQALQGMLFGIKKKWGGCCDGVATTATYDLNSKHKTLKVEALKKFSKGRALEPIVMWRERDNEVLLELTGKVDATKKITVRHNTAKNMTTANASLIRGSWELKPGYNFTKQDAIVALSKKQRVNKFTVTVQPNTRDAMLEWQHKPLTLALKAPLRERSHPTFIFKVERDFFMNRFAGGKRSSSSTAQPGSLVHLEEQRQGPLGKRLQEIDVLHEKKAANLTKLQEAQGKKKKKFGFF